MHRTSIFLALAVSILLSACAKPTAQTYTPTKEEIARERAEQEKFAKSSGASVQAGEGKTYSKAALDAMLPRLQKVVDSFAPQAIALCREMHGANANCDLHVELSSKGKGLNAHADGKKVVIYPAMMEFAKNDTHLAFVLAHEYTHHMMRHVQSSQQNVAAGAILGTLVDVLAQSQGINTQGQAGKLGAQAALLSYSPAFEHEADYIGLYILARAGYKIEEAPYFWREMSRENPQGIYNRTTHPTTPERFIAMGRAIQEIRSKQQQGLRLLPNIKPAA